MLRVVLLSAALYEPLSDGVSAQSRFRRRGSGVEAVSAQQPDTTRRACVGGRVDTETSMLPCYWKRHVRSKT
jgi:hypothetical protein